MSENTICTTEACECGQGMYHNIVYEASETIDYLGLEDLNALETLPLGAIPDDGIAVDGPYEIDEDGDPNTSTRLLVFPAGAVLRIN
jgi:hypothetical protein